MRILVTGCTGLVGSHLIPLLKASGHEVHCLGRSRTSLADFNHHGDLTQPVDLTNLPTRIDVIFHLAQSRLGSSEEGAALDMQRIHVASTRGLLDYALRAHARRFVLASTGGLYDQVAGCLLEDSPLKAKQHLDHYYASKLSGEEAAEAYADRLDLCIVRPFFIYGPGQQSTRLIPRLVASVRQGIPIDLTGHFGTLLNPIFVSDAAEGLAALVQDRSTQVLNISGPEVTSVRALASMVGLKLGLEPEFCARPGVNMSLVSDPSRLIRILGRHLTPLHEGLSICLSAY